MSLDPTDRSPWRWRRTPVHALWLGPDGVWDHGPVPGWQPWWAAAAPQASVQAGPRAHASFDAWCQAHPGAGCQLVLSGWLLHELLLDAHLPLADDAARLAYARNLLQHYHGEAALHWPLTTWQAARRHGVSALHACTLTALQASARRAGVALRRVQPWWSVAMAMAWQREPLLGRAARARLLVVDGALVTQVELARGRITQLLQRRLDSPQPASLRSWHDSLPDVDRSVVLGHGMAAPWQATEGDRIQCLGTLQGPTPPTPWAASPPRARAVLAPAQQAIDA